MSGRQTTARRYPRPVPELIPDDAAGVDLVAVARALSGEHPPVRLTLADRAEMARRLADRPTELARIWHVSTNVARRWITEATRGAA